MDTVHPEKRGTIYNDPTSTTIGRDDTYSSRK
jgi:hypothetical protein